MERMFEPTAETPMERLINLSRGQIVSVIFMSYIFLPFLFAIATSYCIDGKEITHDTLLAASGAYFISFIILSMTWAAVSLGADNLDCKYHNHDNH